MEKEKVDTQIRLGKHLYEYAKSEADRLGVSLNYALNGLIDDGRRFRQAAITVQVVESNHDNPK